MEWDIAPTASAAAAMIGFTICAGFKVEEIKARANKGRGVRHIIWAATKTG